MKKSLITQSFFEVRERYQRQRQVEERNLVGRSSLALYPEDTVPILAVVARRVWFVTQQTDAICHRWRRLEQGGSFPRCSPKGLGFHFHVEYIPRHLHLRLIVSRLVFSV
jgi:hypothetical protein